MVKLASHDEAYGQNWNITDYGVITGEEMIQHIRELAGYTKRIITVKEERSSSLVCLISR